jgi:hypothetical protein
MSDELFGRCVVCGCADARGLTTTRLSRGEVVIVCGTHELVHRRASRRAESVAELRGLCRERRESTRRRASRDELAARLSEAFAVPSNRRRSPERRRVG